MEMKIYECLEIHSSFWKANIIFCLMINRKLDYKKSRVICVMNNELTTKNQLSEEGKVNNDMWCFKIKVRLFKLNSD